MSGGGQLSGAQAASLIQGGIQQYQAHNQAKSDAEARELQMGIAKRQQELAEQAAYDQRSAALEKDMAAQGRLDLVDQNINDAVESGLLNPTQAGLLSTLPVDKRAQGLIDATGALAAPASAADMLELEKTQAEIAKLQTDAATASSADDRAQAKLEFDQDSIRLQRDQAEKDAEEALSSFDPQDRRRTEDAVSKVNKDFQNFRKRHEVGVKALDNDTVAGDKAAILQLARMQSDEALQEADMERAVSSGLVDSRLGSLWRQVRGKERLTPETRTEMRQLFGDQLNTTVKIYGDSRGGIASRINPDIDDDARQRALGPDIAAEYVQSFAPPAPDLANMSVDQLGGMSDAELMAAAGAL